MVKAKYAYDINANGDTLRIIDKWEGNSMSVTNDAEAVLTEIRSIEGEHIEKLRVIYRDSDEQWDTMIPTWENGKCSRVNFKSGVEV